LKVIRFSMDTQYQALECNPPFYFKDPNGIQLEFCCFTRNLNADDARMQHRAEISVRRLGLEDPVALRTAKR